MHERYNNGLSARAGLTALGHRLRRTSAAVLATLGLAAGAHAQQITPYFQADAEARGAAAVAPLAAALTQAQALTLNDAALRAALATAPLENQAGAAPLELALPRPDGSVARFAVRETSVMAPELARRFPSIKTYAGVGLDDASAALRLDLTPRGFHAQVLSGGGQSYYIDPATRADTHHYLAFYRTAMNRAAVGAMPICGVEPTTAELKKMAAKVAAAARPSAAAATGSQLRTFRLALANTAEFAVFAGNTATSVMAAKVTTVNRVVGVYEKELAVRLVLIADNSRLNFLSGTGPQPPTPYTNSNPNGELLDENQANIDAIIGSANYDIGHVFSTAGGGLAQLGVVCDDDYKAQGETGTGSPVGDAFDIDYVAHEMGHQFGGNHPFNGTGESCGGGNRNPATAWEPGSGSTIMAYAGICGSANDLQANSDPTFHTGSYEEIQAFIGSISCQVTTNTGNTAPVVTAPASGKTLPISTPFKLTASATDAENDALTYSWEELDLGPAASPSATQVAGQNVPLFRSFNPTASSTRYFPRLSNLLANTTTIGERLPTVTRALKFRCTARDEHSGPAGVIGGVDYSALVNLSVSSTAGPFVVTAPNTAVTWTGGAAQVVTWNIAGTTNAPVSCATVNIRLSLDGGLTYPTVLASGVPNNGSAVVLAPSPAAATQARLMVEAADNYFFDISNTNFTIAAPAPGPTITTFTPKGGQAGTVVTVLGSNFTGATQVTFNGTAATVFTVNSATQITVTAPVGVTTGPIGVVTPAGTATSATPFTVGSPPVITSFTPGSGYVGSSVVLTGTGFTGATQVTFNGTVATAVTVNSDTQITVTVPAGASTGPIGVTTPVSTGFSATNFTVIPAPVISAFTPTRGVAGTPVVITGFYFTGVTSVTFNNVAAPGFVVNSNNQITVNAPAGVTTGPIRVVTAAGTGVSAASFEVPPANDLCANAIPLTCGQSVTGSTLYSSDAGDPTATCAETIDGGGVFYSIVGTGGDITVATCGNSTNYDSKLFVFSDGCGVYTCVGGDDDGCGQGDGRSSLTFNSVAGTSYLVFVSGFSTAQGRFTLKATCAPAPVPTITALSPASGPAGTVVTLSGTNLSGVTALTVNGVAVTNFTPVSSSSITFTVPAGATTGPVVATSPAGASAGFTFTVTTTTATAQAQQSEFSVYPNPVAGRGSLNLKLAATAASAQVTLRTVLGQVVATRTFSGSATELPMSGLAAGTYLLTVQAAGRAPSVQRVVVE